MTALDAFSLTGKAAIVTGAGSGISRALALRGYHRARSSK
jgi:NAD(P)-dependent dehydrogenase (short-subunit alcohol dehydrogenase family)